MSETETIIRLAAKGDGVTASGEHVRGALPGDLVSDGAIVELGAHHVEPPCDHFGKCGGCQLQHADEAALEAFVHDRVVNAARGQGLEVGEVLPVHLSPFRTRRRATLHGMRTQNGAVLGFREAGSHRIVDLAECHVINPALLNLVQPLRGFIARHGPPKGAVDAQLSLCDQGADLGLTHFALDGLEATEAALDFARDNALARLTIDQGYGPETVWEPEPVAVTLGGVPVPMPPGSFLQATPDAEARMIADADEWLQESKLVSDLFSGLGTFAFALRDGRKLLAVEADRSAHLACKTAAVRAGGSVHALHRDLFRNPLQATELSRFDAALLDPPRAGAKAQVGEIAASDLSRVVYVSCNPSSWARDAAQLVEVGFRLSKLRPVGQFRWSTHVELTSLFER
ncbi:class I SAM-dependent RNA methyltransferase [Erythrobacter sp. THAF29]|uniref:class I SAM-dependent RNA methyltransferase n=1 Tax=Erythrobacter sp. THAF29 TaxID=2587851 RepID=UPI0012684384|nr:class I SAM-dependent RNA methyltransferase [Erythrobacter sp. THAF29]QFT78038.1 23S rRNA (uracil(1939)-C(5))-methyltransferase RlmD [Erythrobacter sp. THAF29]